MAMTSSLVVFFSFLAPFFLLLCCFMNVQSIYDVIMARKIIVFCYLHALSATVSSCGLCGLRSMKKKLWSFFLCFVADKKKGLWFSLSLSLSLSVCISFLRQERERVVKESSFPLPARFTRMTLTERIFVFFLLLHLLLFLRWNVFSLTPLTSK